MKLAIVASMAIAACAPRPDTTPRIDVEPGASYRACYQSQRAELLDAGPPFPDEISLACAVLLSDVKGPTIRFVVDVPDAAAE